MANPILVTGAAGRVGAVGRTVTELLLKQGKAVRAMVRNEDERATGISPRDGCENLGRSQVLHELAHMKRKVNGLRRNRS